MASRTGTVVGFEILRGDDDAIAGETTKVKRGVIYVNNSANASTVIGGTDTLDVALVGNVIAGIVRNGKAITVRGVGPYGAAYAGTTAYGATAAMSTTTLQITPKLATDFAANTTFPANTTPAQRPFAILVLWSEA